MLNSEVLELSAINDVTEPGIAEQLQLLGGNFSILLSPGEQYLANFVLNGHLGEPIALTDQDSRKVRQAFAGTEQLENPDVCYRFQQLNVFSSDNRVEYVPETATLRSKINVIRAVSNEELVEAYSFSDPDASCLKDDELPDYVLKLVANQKTPKDKIGDYFYPARGESSLVAKTICMGCIVLDKCLNSALSAHPAKGVWGGTSDRQRRRLVSLFRDGPKEMFDEAVTNERAQGIRDIEKSMEDSQSDLKAFRFRMRTARWFEAQRSNQQQQDEAN